MYFGIIFIQCKRPSNKADSNFVRFKIDQFLQIILQQFEIKYYPYTILHLLI